MAETEPQEIDLNGIANEADHKIENLLGSKIRVKTEDIKDLNKIQTEAIAKAPKAPKEKKDSMQTDSDPYSHLQPKHSEENLKDKYSDLFSSKLKGLSPVDEQAKQTMIERFALSEFGINKIESGPVFEQNIVYQNLGARLSEFHSMTESLKKIEDLNIFKLKQLVQVLVEQTGPNKDASLLLVNLISSSNHDYFTAHSINVCVFTLIIAIETSKLMMQKILTPEISRDFHKSRLCSLKTFKEDEIIDLGLAALLHDIYIRITFPDLTENSSLTFRDQLEYKRHSIESYRMVQKLSLKKEIEMGILHHHERLDGLGYPDGLSDRVISGYGKVIALADHYERLAFINPFSNTTGPMGAVNQILKKDKSGYDGDHLICFLKATSLFPLGSFIELNSGEIGMVVEIDKETMQKPKVKILFSKNKVQVANPFIIDLNEYPDLKIARAVHPREVKTVLPTIREQLNLRS